MGVEFAGRRQEHEMATKEDEAYAEMMGGTHLTEEERIARSRQLTGSYKGPRSGSRRVNWIVRIIVVLILLTIGGVWLFHKAHPGGLPNGYSQTAFDSYIKSDLVASPFRISGIASVSCVMPNSWVPGKTFTCYVYGSSSNIELGTVTVTVTPTPSGRAFAANLVWRPGA
jgi:hypothetical protein